MMRSWFLFVIPFLCSFPLEGGCLGSILFSSSTSSSFFLPTPSSSLISVSTTTFHIAPSFCLYSTLSSSTSSTFTSTFTSTSTSTSTSYFSDLPPLCSFSLTSESTPLPPPTPTSIMTSSSTTLPTEPTNPPSISSSGKKSYIVVFKEGASASSIQNAKKDIQAKGGIVTQEFNETIVGFAASIPQNLLTTLSTMEGVEYVEKDSEVHAS
ncbi:hypothetical protein HMI54_001446 [Coelomomyces lativittatus]|nr:hypothetical protein HMI54_001446 [Coelomomyces lativittatus]